MLEFTDLVLDSHDGTHAHMQSHDNVGPKGHGNDAEGHTESMLTHGSRLLWGWATSTSELAPHLHRDFAHTCTRRLPHTDDGAHFASANPPLHNRHSPCMPAADASSNTVRSGQYDSSAAVRQKLDGIVRARAGCAEPDGRGHDAFREGAIRKDAEKRSGAASQASSGLGRNGAWTGTTVRDAGASPRLARQDPRTGVRGQAARRVQRQ